MNDLQVKQKNNQSVINCINASTTSDKKDKSMTISYQFHNRDGKDLSISEEFIEKP